MNSGASVYHFSTIDRKGKAVEVEETMVGAWCDLAGQSGRLNLNIVLN
jgi:hypothetical protein